MTTTRAVTCLSRRIFAGHTLVGLLMAILLTACAEEPVRPGLPPSASDLVLLKSLKLCSSRTAFLDAQQGRPLPRETWGSGEEIQNPAARSESGANESFFFDQEGQLVGALFVFPNGRNLKPYPILRDTLSQLRPATEFYLNLAALPDRDDLESTSLYETGDETSTTRYLVLGQGSKGAVLAASIAIDPYETLLSPYRRQYLNRLTSVENTAGAKRGTSAGYEDKESFIALQQFARGEAAQLGYCGTRNHEVAVDAYSRAIARGFSDKARLAEAHHKLGLAVAAQGKLPQARDHMLEALTIQPARPDILNNLGDVYRQMGEREKATAAFEKAVTYRPNYAVARFNLAQAYERENPKLAINEYETYLAIAKGVPEESARVVIAQERVAALKKR